MHRQEKLINGTIMAKDNITPLNPPTSSSKLRPRSAGPPTSRLNVRESSTTKKSKFKIIV